MDYGGYTPGPRRDLRRRRRRQARRRLLALILVVLAVAAVVAVIVLSHRGGEAATGPEKRSTAASTASPRPSTRPGAPPPRVWEASRAEPVRVWVGGDSMGGELGWGLGPMLAKAKVFKPILFYKDSTGICRWDFFDWGHKMRAVMKGARPDAVVVMVGTNDTQSVWQNGHWIAWGDPAWKSAYERRVSGMIATALTGGARRVYWVGMPIMAEGWRNPRMRFINRVVQKAVAEHPGAEYVDSWDLFVDANGEFVPSLRLADGVHFTVHGQRILGRAVLKAIEKDWLPNGPAPPTPVPAASPGVSSI